MLEAEIRTILENYSKWLEETGYLDSDWWCEEPKAIDRYLKENPELLKEGQKGSGE